MYQNYPLALILNFGQNHEKGMKNTVNSPQVELA